MSEQFLAQARVVVSADTKAARAEILALNKLKVKPIPVRIEPISAGFLTQLRKDVNTAASKAPARVPMLPDPKGFLGLLRTEVATAASKAVAAIRMVADPTGFRAALEAEALAASKGVVAPITATISTIVPGTGKAATQAAAVSVPAVPVVDEAAFRTLLQAQVDKATVGVTAKVPAVPVAPVGETTRGTRRQAVTPASESTGKATQQVADATVKATKAEQAFTKAQEASAFARKKLDSGLSIEEKRLERLAREKIALANAEKAVTLAREEGNAALLAQAQAQRTAAAGAVEKTTGTIAGATAKAAKQAELERVALAKEEEAAFRVSAAGIEQAHAEAIAADEARTVAAEREAAKRIAIRKREVRAQASGIEGRLQEQLQRPGVVGAAAAENATVAVRRRLTAATEALASVELAGAGAKNALSRAQQRVDAAEAVGASTKKILTAAERTRSSAVIAEAAALHEKALAEIENQAATLRSAEAEAKAGKAQAFRARGFVAQLATFAGLRGAVLAANAQFIAGTVAAIAFGKAVQSAASFESQLNVFKVTAGATADEMARVSDAARDLGRDVSLPAVSAGSAAQAMTELSKAGLSVQDSIGGARGVLQLATAAQIDNAEATQFAASALNAFGLAGEEAVHVADVLTNAANASQGSIADMAIAMQQASAVARQVGISFEDTVGFLTLLSKAGIQGSDAGTSLRVAFTRLINPTDKAQEVINKLGINLRDAQGNIRPEVFTDFAKAQADLSKKQQDANAAIVFGTDALRAYSIIARAGVGGFAEVSTALEKQGSAAELANARMAGLTGSVENLKNQLSNLGLALGNLSLGPLKLTADTLAVTATNVNAVADALGSIVREAKRAGKAFAENVPQVKIGPIDTKEADKSVDSFVERNAKKLAPLALGAVISPGGTLVALDPVGKAIEKTGLFARDSSKEVQKLLDELNKRQDLPAFNAAIVGLKKMQTELAGGTKEQKKFAQNLDPLIKKIQKLAGQKPIIIPFKLDEIKLPTNLGGPQKAGSDAGRGVIEGLQKELSGANVFGITTGFFDKLAAHSTTSGQRFVHSGELTAKAFGEEVQKGLQTAFLLAVNEVNQGTQALTNAMNQAIIAGAGTATLRGIAQKQLSAALKIVADAQKRLDTIPKTAANKARRKKVKGILDVALEQAAGLTGTVKGFTDQIAADAKSKADAIKDAREKADQAILDSFAPSRARLSDAAARAAATPRGDDDIKVQLALIAQIKRERDTISKTVRNIKTKTTEMRARTSELNQAVLDLKELRKKRDEAIIAAIAQEFAPKIAFAEATGNTSLLIRLLDQEIARINREIRLAKKAKRSTQVLETALADLQDTRNQTQDDLLAALRERAELRLEAGSGSRNAVINAINKQIAQKERERRAVKKFGLKWVQLGNDILQLQADRKEALNAAKETSGLTVFELLKQNVETFNAVGANLIQGNQPFAGPTGFTADVAQFLVAQRSRPTTNLTPSTAGKTKIEINDDRLVRAIDRWTDAVERQGGGGNQTAGTPQSSVVGQRWNAIGEFWEARRTRMAVQADRNL